MKQKKRDASGSSKENNAGRLKRGKYDEPEKSTFARRGSDMTFDGIPDPSLELHADRSFSNRDGTTAELKMEVTPSRQQIHSQREVPPQREYAPRYENAQGYRDREDHVRRSSAHLDCPEQMHRPASSYFDQIPPTAGITDPSHRHKYASDALQRESHTPHDIYVYPPEPSSQQNKCHDSGGSYQHVNDSPIRQTQYRYPQPQSDHVESCHHQRHPPYEKQQHDPQFYHDTARTGPPSLNESQNSSSTAAALDARIGIRDDDVLCGRGGATTNHIGNRKFRSLVKTRQEEYLTAHRQSKKFIAASVVDVIRNMDGRFLKKDKTSGNWYDIGNLKAREKARQALTEGVPWVRKNTAFSPPGSSLSCASLRGFKGGRMSVESCVASFPDVCSSRKDCGSPEKQRRGHDDEDQDDRSDKINPSREDPRIKMTPLFSTLHDSSTDQIQRKERNLFLSEEEDILPNEFKPPQSNLPRGQKNTIRDQITSLLDDSTVNLRLSVLRNCKGNSR